MGSPSAWILSILFLIAVFSRDTIYLVELFLCQLCGVATVQKDQLCGKLYMYILTKTQKLGRIDRG